MEGGLLGLLELFSGKGFAVPARYPNDIATADAEPNFMEQPISASRCANIGKENVMKALFAVGVAAVVALAAASPASAREGCGRGFHRAWNGMCRPNRGTEARWIEGHYYHGQGWWWHNRWYQHRHRRHGVWIYL